MNLFTSVAEAMGNLGGGSGSSGAGGFAGLIPLILMFVIFYFLLIRPFLNKVNFYMIKIIEAFAVVESFLVITFGKVVKEFSNIIFLHT